MPAARQQQAMYYFALPRRPEHRQPPETAEAPRWRRVRWEDFAPDFASLLGGFAPITLAEMGLAALQDRTDTKFLLAEDDLVSALSGLGNAYRVLEIDAVRLNHYRTLYFDTADFALYRQHQVGRRDRYKVRSRSYLDSRLSFLEVKHKVSRNRTVKSRVPTDALLVQFTAETGAFLRQFLPLNPDELEPKLWNEYTRITLVSNTCVERVTLDLNLSFSDGERTVSLPGVAIAEVKQLGVDRQSDFMRRMRALGVRPAGLSKYCVGVAMTHPAVRHNRLNPQLRRVNQLILGATHVY